MRGAGRRLAHDEAGAADARRRLALMRHRGAAAGDQQVLHLLRQDHAVRHLAEAARLRDRGPQPFDVAGDMLLARPAVDADGVVEARAGYDVLAAELIRPGDPPRLADAELRRGIDDIGIGEARRLALEEFEELHHLAAAFDLAGGEFVGIGAVERAAVRLLHLRDVDAPLDRVLLRAHDRALAREFHAAPLGVVHQRRDRRPGLAGGGRIDAVQAEHHGRIEHGAGAVAELERRAGPGGEIAVARAIDEDAADDGGAAGFRLHDQRPDGVVRVHHHAGAERMEQDFGAVAEQEIVGRAFVGRGVVGLRLDLAERDMRLVQAAEPVDARQQLVGDAMHHLAVLAMDVGMQPAERGDAGGGAHAAEEAVALDQQGLAAQRCGRRRRPRCRPARRRAPPRRIRPAPAGGAPAHGWISQSWQHDSMGPMRLRTVLSCLSAIGVLPTRVQSCRFKNRSSG